MGCVRGGGGCQKPERLFLNDHDGWDGSMKSFEVVKSVPPSLRELTGFGEPVILVSSFLTLVWIKERAVGQPYDLSQGEGVLVPIPLSLKVFVALKTLKVSCECLY